jgi:hypothetical protein
VYATKIPATTRKRMSTHRAKILHQRSDKGKFRLILSSDIHKEVFGKIFKRFKDMVIVNQEKVDQEKEERNPRTCNS